MPRRIWYRVEEEGLSYRVELTAPQRLALWRRSKARRTGQLWLMPEIEWAPYQPWEIPGPVFDRIAQLPLFSAAD